MKLTLVGRHVHFYRINQMSAFVAFSKGVMAGKLQIGSLGHLENESVTTNNQTFIKSHLKFGYMCSDDSPETEVFLDLAFEPGNSFLFPGDSFFEFVIYYFSFLFYLSGFRFYLFFSCSFFLFSYFVHSTALIRWDIFIQLYVRYF